MDPTEKRQHDRPLGDLLSALHQLVGKNRSSRHGRQHLKMIIMPRVLVRKCNLVRGLVFIGGLREWDICDALSTRWARTLRVLQLRFMRF
jgi:hypothetical protein